MACAFAAKDLPFVDPDFGRLGAVGRSPGVWRPPVSRKAPFQSDLPLPEAENWECLGGFHAWDDFFLDVGIDLAGLDFFLGERIGEVGISRAICSLLKKAKPFLFCNLSI